MLFFPFADLTPDQLNAINANAGTWQKTEITYSVADLPPYAANYPYVTYSAVTNTKIHDDFRAAIATFSKYIPLTFTEVSIGADIALLQTPQGNANSASSAYPWFSQASPGFNGDVFLNSDQITTFGKGINTYGFESLLHELGHSLGLKHPFEANPPLPPELDKTTFTMMSYNNKGTNCSPTLLDIYQLQQFYGAVSAYEGDTVYLFTAIGRPTINGVPFLPTNKSVRQVLWDSSGNDTFDFSALPFNSAGYTLDIRQGAFSHLNGKPNIGTGIAYGMTVENVVNSSSDDTIYLNSLPNVISGYNRINKGTDTIYESDGSDVIDLTSYQPLEVTVSQVNNNIEIQLFDGTHIIVVNNPSINILLIQP